MKTRHRILMAAIAALALSSLSADGQTDQKISIFAYPAGKFFTPENIPELKGYLCLIGIGITGGPEMHCAPAPFLT